MFVSSIFYLQGPSSFHLFTPCASASGLFVFMAVTSCPKMAAVTPDITSLCNPREDPAEEQKFLPEAPLTRARLHGHPEAAGGKGMGNTSWGAK